MKLNFEKTILCCFVIFYSSLLDLNIAFGQTKLADENLDAVVHKLGESFIKNPESVGLSVGIYNNGKSRFYNFGTTQKGKESLPTQNTVYEIGSITKTFTSFLLAKAVVEKIVKLDDDIRKYIEGNYPNLEHEGEPIRLVHLANTTSGLPNWLPLTPDAISSASPDLIPNLREKIYGHYTRKDFYEVLRNVKLDYAPGKTPKHSNASAQLLAFILEDIYKAPYENLVNKYVLRPLKMKNTSFLASKSKTKLLAAGYNERGILMPYFTTQYLQSAGGLNSNTEDLLKYIKFHLNESNEIVSLSHRRTINPDVYGIGLNWFAYKHENGKSQIWSDGGTYGFTSYLVIYPEANSGIVILANESDDSTPGKLGGIAYEVFKFIGK